jgi:hypothetical protein
MRTLAGLALLAASPLATGCQLEPSALRAAEAADPFDYVTDTGAKAQPALAKPALCAPYTDPVFGTTVTRLTDHAALGFSGVVNEYSKAEPFNADGSLLIVRTTNAHFFLLRPDCQVVRELPFGGSAEPRWSRVDPNLLRFIAGNQIREFRVDTGEVKTLHTFAEYDRVATNGEGDWSLDFDYIALVGHVGSTPKDVFVYRASDDHVFPKLALTGPVQPDWVSITPVSHQVLIMFKEGDRWRPDGASGRRVGYGTDLFDTDMTDRRRVQDNVHHGDLCLTADGQETFVASTANAHDTNAHTVRMTKLADALPLGASGSQDADPVFTDLLTIDWYLGVHFSCRNLKAPGWVYVSTYGSRQPESVPFADEIFAVNLDGSQEVRRLAHLHATTGTYFEEPHAVAGFNGRSFLFTSNWKEATGQARTDVYMVSLPPLPDGGGDGGGGGGGDGGGDGGGNGEVPGDGGVTEGGLTPQGGTCAVGARPAAGDLFGLALSVALIAAVFYWRRGE